MKKRILLLLVMVLIATSVPVSASDRTQQQIATLDSSANTEPSQQQDEEIPYEPEAVAADSSLNGFVKEGSVFYYYENGTKATGWRKLDGYYRYFMEDGQMYVNGWRKQDGYYRYFNEWGCMLTNQWCKIDGYYRYLNEWGCMLTNQWCKIDGYYRYLNEWGCMMTGWMKIDGYYRYLNEWGCMMTGWMKIDGYYRYLNEWGCMMTGWMKIDGYSRYLNEWGCMLTGTQMIDGQLCVLNEWGCLLSSSGYPISQLRASGDADRLIIITATGQTTASVSMYNKLPDGLWNRIYQTSGYLGENGLGKTTEGDKKTPTGVFKSGMAFGISPNPGASVSYLQVDSTHYWNGDSSSDSYNKMISTRDAAAFNTHVSEHIIDFGAVYHYCLDIGYNANCTPYKGSAIFLHCTGSNPYTAGCVAIPEQYMVQTLKNMTDHTKILIGTESQIKTY